MFHQLVSTSNSKLSNATTASHSSLFGRVVFKLKKAFTFSYIAKQGVAGQENLFELDQETQVHLPQVSFIAPSFPPSLTEGETATAFASPASSLGHSVTATPSLTPSAVTTPTTATSSIPHLQVTSELEAAKKRIAELEATIAKRQVEHAAYVQRVEKTNMPYAIKKLTEQRDLFRARLEPAKQEYARKAAERKLVEQEWKEEEERRLTAQLMVIGAKYGLGESAKQYAELEAKFLELQEQPESAQHEAGQGTRGTGI